MYPITGIAAGCERAASGHATAAPPSVARIFVVRCSLPWTLRLGVIHAMSVCDLRDGRRRALLPSLR